MSSHNNSPFRSPPRPPAAQDDPFEEEPYSEQYSQPLQPHYQSEYQPQYQPHAQEYSDFNNSYGNPLGSPLTPPQYSSHPYESYESYESYAAPPASSDFDYAAPVPDATYGLTGDPAPPRFFRPQVYEPLSAADPAGPTGPADTAENGYELTPLPRGYEAYAPPAPEPYNPVSAAPPAPPQPPQPPSFNPFTSSAFSAADPGYESPDEPFKPFPIAGDQYALNTYIEADTTSAEDAEDAEGMEDAERGAGGAADSPGGSDVDFGTAPLSATPSGPQPRRHLPKIKLMQGNLVLDCPVSQQLLAKYPTPRTEREFTYMRYSAATCDPADFAAEHFTLRQTCYQHPRTTELLVVVTIYNEEDILLARTLQGVFRNIRHLTSRNNSSTWGKEAWKKVVVCIVADGRQKLNPRSRALLAALGVYQEGFAKNAVNEKPVTAHIYEFTTLVGISEVTDKSVRLTTEKTVPIQLLFCLKEQNQKKINSHRWCFQAFAPILQPEVVVLLDAGTQPGGTSLYSLWKEFDAHPDVGGACGEIRAMLGSAGKNLLNPLVAAQNFEYKMSNILDKPTESVFGFISVLPGAFSAYRLRALQNDMHGVGPLEKYFKGETLHSQRAGVFTANMYLAEDRILCFELVAKKNCAWVLRYVSSAHAATDVPARLAEFVLQRRRWLNGSFFAAVYAVAHSHRMFGSGHSLLRKLVLAVEMIYQVVNLLLSWFSIACFFLVFRILTGSIGGTSEVYRVLSFVFLWLYGVCLVSTFVLAFGNRPKGTEKFYLAVVTFFAVLMVYLLVVAVVTSVNAANAAIDCNNGQFSASLFFTNATFRTLVVSVLSTYVLYLISSLVYLDPWHFFTSLVQYVLLTPSFINVLNVYAFCNIHDISWGTKGDAGEMRDLGVATSDAEGKLAVEIPTRPEEIDANYGEQIGILLTPYAPAESAPRAEDIEQDYYALVRSSVVLAWIISNFVVVAVVLQTGGMGVWEHNEDKLTTRDDANCDPQLKTREEIFMAVILWTVAGLAAFRFVGCLLYRLMRLIGM